jgi:hypothetical protein
MKGLKDKVATVTGNSGFGRATSVTFAREGVRVVVAARSQNQDDETLMMIDDIGGEGVFIQQRNTPKGISTRSWQTNLTAGWLSMKYELRQMVKQGSGGAIV